MRPRIAITLVGVLPLPRFVDDPLERLCEVFGDSGRVLAACLDDDPGSGGGRTARSSTLGCAHALRITGTISEWEAWTAMSFPESGDYWFPGGLTTVRIDHPDNPGAYWEPNVWMHHAL